MFCRTVSAARGEMPKPPSSAQCMRACSTAGAMLAGYFPHLRGTFSFPDHLQEALPTGETPQKPQIASILASQGLYDAPIESVESAGPSADDIRTSVVAALMDKEYRPKIQRLEEQCFRLMAAKQQSEANAQIAAEQSEKTRELNRRLCKELNEVRLERTTAMEDLEKTQKEMVRQAAFIEELKDEAEKAQKALKMVRDQNSASQSKLLESLRKSEQQVLELTLKALESDDSTAILSEGAAPSVTSSHAKGMSSMQLDVALPLPEIRVEAAEPGADAVVSSSEATCRCNDHSAWGCPACNIYSNNLLLAHRQLSTRIAKGPPGLELEAPPGLEHMGTVSRKRAAKRSLRARC